MCGGDLPTIISHNPIPITLPKHHHHRQVFISGELHGDERIGPVVSMHVLRLMLKVIT